MVVVSVIEKVSVVVEHRGHIFDRLMLQKYVVWFLLVLDRQLDNYNSSEYWRGVLVVAVVHYYFDVVVVVVAIDIDQTLEHSRWEV